MLEQMCHFDMCLLQILYTLIFCHPFVTNNHNSNTGLTSVHPANLTMNEFINQSNNLSSCSS